ncbi:MAG: hypothetical protein FIB08_07565 [Candidatus Methanoperedens sp.]|nr:hypothetical protein [Candidatus Methanoperedens sp.]
MARPKTSKLSSSESKEAIRIFGTFQERGFSISKDKNGYFIHTHRCRSKSYKSLSRIPAKVIKFIKSTG